MIDNFAAVVDKGISDLLGVFTGLIFDSRLSLITAFSIFIPFWSLVLIVDYLGKTKKTSRRVLKLLNNFFLFGLSVNVSYNTYYFSTKGIDNLHGRMHLVAALCCLLFIIYLSYDYRASSDIRIGIMISYMGISLSMVTLPLEYFPATNNVLSTLFQLGLCIYFFGLVCIGLSKKIALLVQRFRGE